MTKARERAAMIDEMIARADNRIARLTGDLRDLESESARAAIKRDIDAIGKEKDSLIAERERVSADIGKREITEADVEYIRATARVICRKLNGKPTYEEKRALFDAIGLTIQLQNNGQGRALYVVCGLAMQGETLSLEGKKARDYPIVQSFPACVERRWSRGRGRACISRRPCARCPNQSRSAAPSRTCAGRDTIRTARAAACA